MEARSLPFDTGGPEPLDGPDLDVRVWRGAVPDADRLVDELRDTLAWQQDHVVVHGKRTPVPRLQAWYGDPGTTYTYSGIRLEPRPWTPALDQVRAVVEELAGAPFNSVLANRYRHGSDSVAWHADDEPELGDEPVIASVSLGATRRFSLRRRDDVTVRHDLDLAHGDVVVMAGATQRRWVHQAPKTTRPVGERVNLTYRWTVPGH